MNDSDNIRSEFINSITSKDKEGFWGDIHAKYGDLREVRRNSTYRYEIFKLMNYEPHEAQRKFHDAVPKIIEVQKKLGVLEVCDHPEFNILIDPKDPAQTTRQCKRCKAEFRNHYHNRFRCIIAAARWGKSLCVGKEGVLPLLWPGIDADGTLNREKAPRAYIYSPSYNIGRHEFNYVTQGMEELGLTPERYSYSPQTGNMYARWSWGAEITVKSWDNPTSILGDEIDCAIFAEASTLPNMKFERYIRARMGSRLAYCIMGSTPHGIGEFLEDYYWRGQDPSDHEVWSDSFGLMSNPHHPIEDIEEARASLDERTFSEQYEGKFVSMAGLVFDTFDRGIHVKPQIQEPERIPKDCQIVFGIDFGKTAPTACLMAYWDKDGCIHIMNEYYVAGETIKNHFNNYLKDWLIKYQPEWLIYDYQQVEAAQFLQDEIFALEEQGLIGFNKLKMIPCKKGKKNGTERIRQLLHYNPKTQMSQLEVDPSCVNFVNEILHYTNKKGPDGRILDEPDPHSKYDHLMDTIEYIVATSYEDAQLRRDRKNMLDMSEQKPAKAIHQLMMAKIREQAEENDEDIEEEAEWLENGEEDDEAESYTDWDGY